jgi:SAM-dependent methyltransferase
MEDFARKFAANAQQAQYWNVQAGPKWARNDESMNVRMAPLTTELFARLQLNSGEHVLDIGCGGGRTSQLAGVAVGEAGRVVGMDISETMLAVARARCQDQANVAFENVDAQVESLPQAAFDVLASRFGVMFFDDPYAAFANLIGALKPGGRMQFVCWAPLELNEWFTVPANVVRRRLGAPDPTDPRAPGPLAFSEQAYVQDILGKAGFRDINIDSFSTTMSGSEPTDVQTRLFMELGPAARILAKYEPDAATLAELATELRAELEIRKEGDAVPLGATVYYVSARR